MAAGSERSISPLRAVVFAVGLTIALILVVSPALPGSVQAGGRLITNQLSRGDGAAAVLVSLLAGVALGLYLYLFQPRGLDTRRRLGMLAVVIVVWLAAAKVFLSI